MDDCARAAGAAPGARPQSFRDGRGRRADQLRAPCAADRAAHDEILEGPRAELAGARVAWLPAKYQIGRAPPFAFSLAAVARHRVARPGPAPVVGALGGPGKIRRVLKVPKRPGAVIVDVADEAEFTV